MFKCMWEMIMWGRPLHMRGSRGEIIAADRFERVGVWLSCCFKEETRRTSNIRSCIHSSIPTCILRVNVTTPPLDIPATCLRSAMVSLRCYHLAWISKRVGLKRMPHSPFNETKVQQRFSLTPGEFLRVYCFKPVPPSLAMTAREFIEVSLKLCDFWKRPHVFQSSIRVGGWSRNV